MEYTSAPYFNVSAMNSLCVREKYWLGDDKAEVIESKAGNLVYLPLASIIAVQSLSDLPAKNHTSWWRQSRQNSYITASTLGTRR